MRCVDTCFIIDLLRGDQGALSKAESLDREGGAAISSISLFELWMGLGASGSAGSREASLKKVLDRLDIFDLDAEASREGAAVFKRAQKEGRSIEQNDALVAGTCISSGCRVIVTRNLRHFQGIRGLKAESY